MANITVNIDGLTTGNPEAVSDLMDIVGDSTKFDNVTSSNEVEYNDEQLDNFETIFSDEELEEAIEVQPDLFDDEFDVTYKNGRRVYDFHEINKAMKTLLPDWEYTGDVYDGDELNLIYEPNNSRASLNKEMISELRKAIAEKFGKDVRVRTGHSEYAPEQKKIYIGFLCDEGEDDVADEYKPEMEEEEELLTEKSKELNETREWDVPEEDVLEYVYSEIPPMLKLQKICIEKLGTDDTSKVQALLVDKDSNKWAIVKKNKNYKIKITEDTVKQGSSWVNKGKEGTHGKFKTKKAADAQRKAMFAQGYKAESVSSVESDIADLIEDGVVEEGMTLEEQVESVCSLIGQKIDEIDMDEIKARLGVKGNKGQQPNMKIKPTKDAKKEVDESVDYIGSRKVAMNPNRKFEQIKAYVEPKNPLLKRAAYVVSQFDNGTLTAMDANKKLDRMMAGMNIKPRSVFEANKKPEGVNEEYHSNPDYEDDELDTYEYLYSLLINGNISQYKEKLSKMDRYELRGYKAWANEMGLKEKSLKLEYANTNTNPSKINRYEPISEKDDTNTYEYIWSSLVNGNFEQYNAQLKQLNNDEIKEYISWAEDMGIPYEDLHLEYITESINPDYMYNNQENKIAKGGLKPCQPTRVVKTINSRRKEYQGYCPKEDDLMRDKVVAIAESYESVIKNTDEKLYPALQKRITSKLIDAGASTKFARQLIEALFK